MAWQTWQDYMDARDDYGTTRIDNGGEASDARPWLPSMSEARAARPGPTWAEAVEEANR